MSTYLLVLLLSAAIPFIFSFERKLHFYKYWKYLFPAALLTMLFFIPWDVIFTRKGIWGFNPFHITGLTLLGLPFEEWLFFIIIPYSSIFTYEVILVYLPKDYLKPFSRLISAISIILLSVISMIYYQKAYTFVTALFSAIYIFVLEFIIRIPYSGRFYIAYLFILIPFTVVNGILTGTLIMEEVVWYNDNENLGIRFFTIPIEDLSYGFLLFLMNLSFYETFKKLY